MWVRDGAVYSGPLLIRGRQIDGTGKVHITSSKTDAQSGAALFLAPIAATWLDIPSSTLVSAPGCYAYQVDGMNFTYHIVFQAKYAP